MHPNIELTNQKGDRVRTDSVSILFTVLVQAADIARRNGVADLLNTEGVNGVKLSY